MNTILPAGILSTNWFFMTTEKVFHASELQGCVMHQLLQIVK